MTPRSFYYLPAQGFLLALAFTFLLAHPQAEAHGQSYDPDSILNAEGYITPPDTIVQAALAPRHLNFSFSDPNADGSWFMDFVSDGLPHIEAFAKPYHELGGAFIDFAANRSRRLTTRGAVGIQLRSTDGETMDIQVPDGARISNQSWSPDGE